MVGGYLFIIEKNYLDILNEIIANLNLNSIDTNNHKQTNIIQNSKLKISKIINYVCIY